MLDLLFQPRPFKDCYFCALYFLYEVVIGEIDHIGVLNLDGEIASRKETTDDFIKKVSEVSDTLIIGEYLGSKKKVLCRCPKCGHQWSASPSHLLQGQSCPKCSRTNRLTQEEYEERLKRVNPTLTNLGIYKNNSTPIKTVCNKCGFIWYPRPYNLLMGTNCPQCFRNARKSNVEKFIQDLEIKNPGYRIIGNYINRSTPVETQCEQCGYLWRTKPSHLLSGHGCPKCARLKNKHMQEDDSL